MVCIYREQHAYSAAAFAERALIKEQVVCAQLVHQIDKKMPIITVFVRMENMMMEQIHVLIVQLNVELAH